MAKIYLVAPPYGESYKKAGISSCGPLQPPLGLAYIASHLKQKGHLVKIFDTIGSRNPSVDVLTHLKEFIPDFVLFTATTPQMCSALALAGSIKQCNPAVPIIFGGAHVSALPMESLSYDAIDIVVCGEGEVTLGEIVEGKKLHTIQGICFLDEGNPRVTDPRPLQEDLDRIAFPLWEQLPVKKYKFYHFLDPCVGVLSGRGCPYHCTFCASGVIHQHRYRLRSPSNFIDEVELLHKRFDIKRFYFFDETFTADEGRVRKICALIKERKLVIKWVCMTRANNLSKALMCVMKDAGCSIIGIGIESGDQRILDKTKKGISLDQVKQAVAWARESKIKVVGYFIVGLPYETKESLEKTILFAQQLKLYNAHFLFLVPLPGTAIWEMVQKGEVLRCTAKDWDEYTRFDKAIVDSDLLSKDDLMYFYRRMIIRYFFNPVFMMQKLFSIRSVEDLAIYLKGGIGVIKMALQNK